MAETKITATEVNPTYRQSGWGYVTFSGSTNSANVSVTFPTAFAVAPKVIMGALGYKISTAPTAVSDFTGVYGGGGAIPFTYAVSITTTGFTAYVVTPTAGVFGASFGGFTWIAEA